MKKGLTQISQMPQIKNGRGLRAEGLGQRENRYGMNRIIWIIRIKK